MRYVTLLIAVAVALPGQQSDSYLTGARKAEASGDLKTAESEYRRVLRAHPDAAIYLRLGLVCHLQNKFGDAIPAFRSSLKLQPEQWSARLFLGIDLYRTNDFLGAQEELKHADRLKPGDYDIRFWIGVTQLARKQYFQGLETLETLLQEKPGNLEVLRILAENYAAIGAALLNKVAEDHPDSLEGMLVHAHALEFEGANDAALDVYQEIERRWPGRDGVHDAIERLTVKPSSPRRPSPEAVGDVVPVLR